MKASTMKKMVFPSQKKMRQLSVLFLASSLQPAPLQAQVSWPALQAVALCFLPVAGGNLSSFGTGFWLLALPALGLLPALALGLLPALALWLVGLLGLPVLLAFPTLHMSCRSNGCKPKQRLVWKKIVQSDHQPFSSSNKS